MREKKNGKPEHNAESQANNNNSSSSEKYGFFFETDIDVCTRVACILTSSGVIQIKQHYDRPFGCRFHDYYYDYYYYNSCYNHCALCILCCRKQARA